MGGLEESAFLIVLVSEVVDGLAHDGVDENKLVIVHSSSPLDEGVDEAVEIVVSLETSVKYGRHALRSLSNSRSART